MANITISIGESIALFANTVYVEYPDLSSNMSLGVNGAVWLFMAIVMGIVFQFFECCLDDKHRTRLSFIHWWNHSKLPLINEIIDSIIGIVSMLLFVYGIVDIETYYDEFQTLSIDAWKEPTYIWYQFMTSCFLVLHWLLEFYMTPQRMSFVFKPYRMAMILSVTPGFLGPIFGFYYFGFQFFHFLRIYDTLNFLRNRDFGFKRLTIVLLDILILTLGIFGVLFVTSSLVYVHESLILHPENGSITSYLETFYFLFITVSTVGYGDFSPNRFLGRLSVMVGITAGLWLIPISISQMAHYYKDIKKNFIVGSSHKGHSIIVTPHSHCTSLILKYFSRTHPENLVVFSPDTSFLKSDPLISKPEYSIRTVYFNGTLYDPTCLRQIRLSKAKVCFLLCDYLHEDPMKQDALTLITGESILHVNRNIRLYAQIRCYQNRNIFGKRSNIKTVCGSQLENTILAKSITSPGFSTLLGNLILGQPDNIDPRVDSHLKSEYWESLDIKIFINFNLSNYVGLRFYRVVSVLTDLDVGILIIGIYQRNKGIALIKPSNKYVITKEDTGIVFCTHDQFLAYHTTVDVQDSENSSDTSYEVELSSADMNTEELSDSYEVKGPRSELNNAKFVALEAQYKIELQKCEKKSYDEGKLMDHTIIYRYDIENFEYFFEILESAGDLNQRDIVILTEKSPPFQLWNRLNEENSKNDLRDIHLVIGSGTDLYDLRRTGVDTCSKFMIFAQNQISMADSDARALLIYRFVQDRLSQQQNTNCFAVIELLNPPNTNFLSSSAHFVINEYYASGRVLLPSILDYLMIEDHYQHGYLEAFTSLLKSQISIIPATSFLDFQGEEKHKFLDIVFQLLSERNLLPIGIYRNYSQKNSEPEVNFMKKKKGELSRRKDQPYILIGSNTSIYEDDYLYVINSEDHH